MHNKEIAAIFLKIADALEVKDENVFKIRAYRTAAQNITNLARQLEDVYKEDPDLIGNIPGIGKDLKEKIIELIKTGELKYFEDLRKEFPDGFLELLDLAGLGPKKLKKLRDELGIENADDLTKACEDGKLEDLEGMGTKTQEKLLDAIGHFKKSAGRMLLPEAYDEAEEIVAYLKKSKNFKKIEKAGSLRRGQETVGDLDILATAKDASGAMEYFTSYPKTENIIAKGETKSSINIKNGPQVDLRVIDDGCFGAAWVYFTGSKQHNIKLRKIAKAKNWKVSEYGVFSVPKKTGKEKFLAGKTEEDLYKKLGMDWVAPEMREDQGEIEAAIEGKLPKNLIELKHLKGDLHMHTVESDGRSTIEDMASRAKKKGYEYIAVTEHTKNVRIANGLDEKRLTKHIERIRKADKKIKGIKILAGAEVDILTDGKLDIRDPVLKELDIVIAAIHSKFNLDKDKQTERVLRAIDNKYVNILAHPSGRLITTRQPLQLDFDRIFEAARNANVFMEINTHGERIDLNDVNARRANDLGVRFSINTDAHDEGQLDKIIFGVITARRGWVQKKDVLNTFPLEKMLKAIKRK